MHCIMIFLQFLYHFLRYSYKLRSLELFTSYKLILLAENKLLGNSLIPWFGLLSSLYFALLLVTLLLSLFAKSSSQNVTLIYSLLSYILMVINAFKQWTFLCSASLFERLIFLKLIWSRHYGSDDSLLHHF